ncbi:hypothetical protein [Herbaspirillum camelliae]|uniref:hypothetical protein n=1 Tax=Herbaspirillum camelliae TaxID=1892903 RepID=UPI00117A0F60|nr:hypothetical protein [Herbaspirillum camelliae]
MEKWIKDVNALGRFGIEQMAELSDRKTLQFFWQFFGSLAVLFLVLSIVLAKWKNPDLDKVKYAFGIAWILCFWMSGSIGVWSKRGSSTIEDLIEKIRLRAKQGFIWGMLCTVVVSTLCLTFILIPSGLPINWPAFFLSSLAGAVFITSALTVGLIGSDGVILGLLYGPAICALLYLKLVIYSARLARRIGRKVFHNLLVVYFLVMTAYFTLFNFPLLMTAWGIPRICS